MAPRRKKKTSRAQLGPGTFRPGLPKDSHEVVHLFAVAARAVCAAPDGLDGINRTLQAVMERLVPPESLTAEECARLWGLFARVARSPKESLRVEAGRAFRRDLDTLGQRLDLAPLRSWEKIPQAIEDRNPVAPQTAESSSGRTLEELRAEVRKKRRAPNGPQVLSLVNTLTPAERDRLFKEVVADGTIARGDANLVARFVTLGRKVGAGDDVLRDVLNRLGKWLAR